jgi:hypothetical protein
VRIIESFQGSDRFSIDKKLIYSWEDVREFFESLYFPFIKSKKNPNPTNLFESIDEWIKDSANKYMLITVLDNEKLIGWKITKLISRDNNIYLLWWTAHEQWYEGIVQYLEYLAFMDALEHKVDIISMGVSPNATWSVPWSSPGVALHKLKYGFLPYVNHNKLYTDVDPDTFVDDTLIFLSSDDIRFDAVDVYTDLPPWLREEKYSLLAKRWLQVNYKFLVKK